MKVFVTGASGFVGSAVVKELLGAGHKVLGLARSEASMKAVKALGAEVLQGDLEDIASLRAGAEAADGVIHTAFVHDFSKFERSCELDRQAIETMGKALMGSGRPMVMTSGTALVKHGQLATETQTLQENAMTSHRARSEMLAMQLADKGLKISVVRLSPSVHGEGDHGFVPALIRMAREHKKAAFVGDGQNRWPGVHRLDAANLYRLALEKGEGWRAYHGASEEGVPFRKIAEVIGKRLEIPVGSKNEEEAKAYFTWLAPFVQIDNPTSSEWTRQFLGWEPRHKDLLADLDSAAYFGK